MLWVELGEVDVPTVAVLLCLSQEDSKLAVVLKRLNLLVVDGHVSIRVYALEHAQLGGHHPLLLVVLLLNQVSLLAGISASSSELVHHA